MSFHTWKADDGSSYGSFETFYIDDKAEVTRASGEPCPPGWYWWACFPGCLPDDEPIGPFPTEKQATADAFAEG